MVGGASYFIFVAIVPHFLVVRTAYTCAHYNSDGVKRGECYLKGGLSAALSKWADGLCPLVRYCDLMYFICQVHFWCVLNLFSIVVVGVYFLYFFIM